MDISALLKGNQFASGGVLVMMLGATLAMLKSIPGKIWHFVRGRFIVSVEITSDSDVFPALHLWLNEQPYAKKAKNIFIGTLYDKTVPILGTGPHFMWMDHRPFWIHIDRSPNQSASWNKSDPYVYTVNIETIGRSHIWITKLIETIDARHRVVIKTEPQLHTWSRGDWWGKKLPIRTLANLVLPSHVISQVVDDAKAFCEAQAYYYSLGIPYRRGYLLHGPPGTGKTSLAIALAHELGRDLYFAGLTDPLLDDAGLTAMFSDVSEKAIILIEDIDTIFLQRERKIENKLTFGGLLNVLDGVASTDDRILVMTTNKLEALDPALIRHGRIDTTVKLDNASADQAKRLFLRFFPNQEEFAIQFGYAAAGRSMATIQEHLLSTRNNIESAVAGPQITSTNPILIDLTAGVKSKPRRKIIRAPAK